MFEFPFLTPGFVRSPKIMRIFLLFFLFKAVVGCDDCDQQIAIPGPRGLRGATGQAGATGTSLTGQQGPTGQAGATGATGAQGATGSCPTANITGTGNAVVTNFTSCGSTGLIKTNSTSVTLGGDPVTVFVTGQLQLDSASNQMQIGNVNPVTINVLPPATPGLVLTFYDPGTSCNVQQGIAAYLNPTTDTILTSAQSGSLIVFNPQSAALFTITLPSPFAGDVFHFKVSQPVNGGSGGTAIASPVATVLSGNYFQGGTGVITVTTKTSCTASGTASANGDWFDFWSDGTLWMISGSTSNAALVCS